MSGHRMKVLSAVFVSLLALLSAGAMAKELAQQSSQQQGVTVRAKPLGIAADANGWTFEIVLETHSQDLTDDLVRTVALIDDSGRRHTALAWDGPGPGGHHRKGLLRFAAVKPMPSAIELRLQRPGETAPRTFRWQLR